MPVVRAAATVPPTLARRLAHLLTLVGSVMVAGCGTSPENGGVQASTPPHPPAPLRACRESTRDTEGGFCDATALWGAAEGFDVPAGRDESLAAFLSAGDFDGDGHPDLFLTVAASGGAALLLWRDGGFFNATASWSLPREPELQATALADFDGDGHPDLVAGSSDSDAVAIYANSGSRLASDPLLLPLGAQRMVSALLPWDLDQDGLLDLLVGSYRTEGDCQSFWVRGCLGALQAFRQTSIGRFEPIPVALGPRRVLGIRAFDWDDDGRDEVLVGADFGMFNAPNALLRVRPTAGGGVALQDATEGTGFAVGMFAMGIAPLDVDGDGRDEIYIPNIGPNVLLRREAGVGRDVAAPLGADAYGETIPGRQPEYRYFDPENPREGPMGRYQDAFLRPSSGLFVTSKWAAVVMDFDDDGIDDVFLPASGSDADGIFPSVPDAQSVLLRGTGRALVDATSAARLGQPRNASMAVSADFDGDGDLDLAVMLEASRNVRGGLQLLRNDASTGRSLVVQARGRGTAREGIGAMVELRVGARRAHRRLDGNLSVSGTGPNEAHFGLGLADAADEVTVRFPSGAVVRRTSVPAGRVVIEE